MSYTNLLGSNFIEQSPFREGDNRQCIKKFLAFYERKMFTAVFTKLAAGPYRE